MTISGRSKGISRVSVSKSSAQVAFERREMVWQAWQFGELPHQREPLPSVWQRNQLEEAMKQAKRWVLIAVYPLFLLLLIRS